MMMMIILAVVLTVATYIGLTLLENLLIEKMFTSTAAKTKYVNERYDSLRKAIQMDGIRSKDGKKLQRWLDQQPYTAISISDGSSDVFTAGWISSRESTISGGSSRSQLQENRHADPKQQKADLYNRTVQFRDGKYYVYINVYREYRWKTIGSVLNVVAAAFVFIITMLWYNKTVLVRIIRLSDNVQRISDGEMDQEIRAEGADEIGALARNVDLMRNSILEKLQNEKAAWDANTELITSMSHDIRTPLTSLIGYLDIIKGRKFNSGEEFNKYIDSSLEKAIQLKDLSDKLFQYFLVFSNDERERALEVLDAGIFFQQILVEHISELMAYEYAVNLQYSVPEEVMIRTDVSSVRRLFDNLFSNIMKYADKKFTIEIKADQIAGRVKIVLSNHISVDARKVESNKIGVKTCKKICDDLGVGFHAMEEEKIYTTEILYPILSEEEAQKYIEERVQRERVEEERKAETSKEEGQLTKEKTALKTAESTSGTAEEKV